LSSATPAFATSAEYCAFVPMPVAVSAVSCAVSALVWALVAAM
jgi:hypothetical protein